MNRLDQGRAKSARSDALANRGRILEAAREVFAHRGVDAEMKEIAERAGVGIGTLYRHFEGREALLSALLQLTKEQMLRRLQAAVQADDPRDALRAMIRAGMEVCEQFGALTEAMLAGQLHHLHGGHAEFTELLANLLQRGMREGIFRSDLDVPAVVAIVESIFTAGTLLKFAAHRSYRGAADAIAEFLLQAIVETPRHMPLA
jgi:AcrR family transcriptional regulator